MMNKKDAECSIQIQTTLKAQRTLQGCDAAKLCHVPFMSNCLSLIPLKPGVHLNNVQKSWSYFTQNILRVCYIVQSVKVVYWNSRDSSVGIATALSRLDDRGVGVRIPVVWRIFSYPRRPDRLWGPPNLLSNGYRGKAAGAWSWPLTSN
jgi:hypothetical protein